MLQYLRLSHSAFLSIYFASTILLQNSFAKLFSLIFPLRRSSQTIHGKFFCKNFHAKFFCKILIAKSSLTNDLFAPLHQQTVSNASNHKIQNQTRRHSNRRFLNCNSHKSFFFYKTFSQLKLNCTLHPIISYRKFIPLQRKKSCSPHRSNDHLERVHWTLMIWESYLESREHFDRFFI